MKVTVFGAGGFVGHWIVKLLLEQGQFVTVLLTSPEKSDFEKNVNLLELEGDVLHYDAVLNATRGADCIIAATGSAFMNGKRTSSGLGTGRKPVDDLRTAGATNIVSAMQEAKVKRLLFVGISGILQKTSTEMVMDDATYPKYLFQLSSEHRRTYELLCETDLDWTMVCPSQPLDGEPTTKYRTEADNFLAGGTPNTGDIAHFIVNEALLNNFIRKRVAIAV